jgi:hypothetical protein
LAIATVAASPVITLINEWAAYSVGERTFHHEGHEDPSAAKPQPKYQ